jgi:hypothetical protein
VTEREFWELIDLIDEGAIESGQGCAIEPLISSLAGKSVGEIESFSSHLADMLYKLDTRAHYVAGILHEDDFLHSRCYTVAMGQDFFADVLQHPRRMPDEELPELLSVPSQAWARRTGKNVSDWSYSPSRKIETESNTAGWHNKPNTIALIGLENSRELLEEMIAANPREKAALGAAHRFVGRQFASLLVDADFSTPKYRRIFLRLTPFLNHGSVRHIDGEPEDYVVHFEAGVRPRVYLALDEKARSRFFVSIVGSALLWLAGRDHLDPTPIRNAQAVLLEDPPPVR